MCISKLWSNKNDKIRYYANGDSSIKKSGQSIYSSHVISLKNVQNDSDSSEQENNRTENANMN